MPKKYIMHVISGTHWDREWRHTAEQSKPRLVELIDSMIEILENNENYKVFCLDGGMVVLEDYLTIRPEKKEKLKKLAKSGRISLANWYTLPEMFTVAAEALIRNLKLGQQMAKEYGGAMKSGYTPTSYGQISQLPQIYKEFGIDNAIFYRGTTKYLYKPLFVWEGLDGSKLHVLRTFDEVTRTNWFFYIHQPLVLGKKPVDLTYYYNQNDLPVHMCDSHYYERGFKLLQESYTFNKDKEALKKALDFVTSQAMQYAVGNNLLALNMEDNSMPFKLLPDMIEALNTISEDIGIIQSSLDEYMHKIISESKASDLLVHKGELRYTGVIRGFNGLLGATHSSRIKLKILNEEAETELIHLAEPIASTAWLFGFEYPRRSLQRAWRYLMLNHAHDNICGAAVDQAHEDMLYNFSTARMVGKEIASRGIISLFSNINTSSNFKKNDHIISVFNTLAFKRSEVIQLIIDLPDQGSTAGIIDPCTGFGSSDNNINYYDIIDSNGNSIEYITQSKEKINIAVERELDTNAAKMPAVRHRILLKAEVPPIGYNTYALRPRGPKYITNPEVGSNRKLIARESGTLENEYLKVTMNPNGTFSLLHKPTGFEMKNQHFFTDNGEVGSAHLSEMPQRNPVQTSLGSFARITLAESSTLRGVFQVDLSLQIPAGATIDKRDRLREKYTMPITFWIILDKDSKYLKIKTKIENYARDHRLRVNFPTHINTDSVAVESAFAIEKRNICWTITGDNFESFYPFQPMQNFIDVSDNNLGLAILNKGLREYEVIDDPARTIAITLLRTHRAYMTANSDMTPEEFDRYTGLHSFGTLEYNYAIFPHKGNWEEAGSLQIAYQHKVPLCAIQGVPSNKGKLPPEKSFITIKPADKLVLSALKQAEDGSGIILRMWNSSNNRVSASIDLGFSIKSASLLKLDETPVSELDCNGKKIELQCGPHKIVTILLKIN